jgi:hypothetical protein
MPVGPFRTTGQPVNAGELERRFDAGADVTPESLRAKGLIKTLRNDVKILGQGELTKKLAVSAHGFSAAATEKIEAAGGSVTRLRREPRKKRAATEAPAASTAPTSQSVATESRSPATEPEDV